MANKHHPSWFVAALAGFDLLAAALGSALAYWIRFHVLDAVLPPRGGYEHQDYARQLPAAAAAWIAALHVCGMYGARRRLLDLRSAIRILQASLVATLLLLAYLFFVRPASVSPSGASVEFSRVAAVVWLACTTGCLLLGRWAADRATQHLRRRRHMAMARVAIVGTGVKARRLAKILRRRPEFGRRLVGAIAYDPKDDGAALKAPLLGSLEDFKEIIQRHGIDEVIVARADLRRERLQQLIADCEKDLVDFKIIPDVTEILFSPLDIETVEDIALLGFRESPLFGLNAPLKRMFDFAASAVMLLLLSPVMLWVAWRVRRETPGPALFQQARIGADGRHFTMLKFRTMPLDAEKDSGPVFAEDEDPRATPLGKRLRRLRIDEWPQLINVLRGEMSLVGPRPERPYFVDRFKDSIPRYMARHRVKSGITGWAQVNGLWGMRGSIEQRLQFDIQYIEEWSWGMDLQILWLTFMRLLRPRAFELPIPAGIAPAQTVGAAISKESSETAPLANNRAVREN